MGLKTVKDLIDKDPGRYFGQGIIHPDEIKQEVIKWIKKAKELEYGCVEIQNWQGASYHAGFSKALKIFNNITVEDLK